MDSFNGDSPFGFPPATGAGCFMTFFLIHGFAGPCVAGFHFSQLLCFSQFAFFTGVTTTGRITHSGGGSHVVV
jgi:hypothetical protein